MLNLLEFKVEIIIDDTNRRMDWKDLSSTSVDDFLSNITRMGMLILGKQIPISFAISPAAVDDVNKISLNGLIEKNYPLYVAAGALTSEIYRIEKKTLINEFVPKKNEFSECEFIGVGFRRSMHDVSRNTDLRIFMEDIYYLIARFPKKRIKIFTDRESKSFLKDEIARNHPKIVAKVETQKSDDFVGAIDEMQTLGFYLQRAGGGIGSVAIYSSVPYLILNIDNHTFFDSRWKKIVPWAKSDQDFYKPTRILRRIVIKRNLDGFKSYWYRLRIRL
jgi:hypothetical protein